MTNLFYTETQTKTFYESSQRHSFGLIHACAQGLLEKFVMQFLNSRKLSGSLLTKL